MPNNAGLAQRFFGAPFEKLSHLEQRVIHDVVERRRTTRNLSKVVDEELTFGQRVADRVAEFGGSWTFVGMFAAVMLVWVALNALLLVNRGTTFDPYPYILLNLFLSMLAAIQAPIILMSQNRQSEKDRISAEHDYEVDLKAELEIMLLHEKIDLLREKQWDELLQIQKEQLQLLAAAAQKNQPLP